MSTTEYSPRKGCSRIAIVFIVLLLLSAAAVTFTTLRQQSKIKASGLRTDEASPNLGLFERFLLQNYLLNQAEALQQPAGNAGEVRFQIEAGSTADRVIDSLVEAGLLENQELFLNYLRYYGLDSQLQTGQFTLSGNDTIPQLAGKITRGSSRDITLNFLEGMRLEEIARYLAVVSPARIDADEFLRIARGQSNFDTSIYPFLNSLPPAKSLEGYLFPGTYSIPPSADAAYLVNLMLQNFNVQVTPGMRQAYGAAGLSLHEAVTLASIVERETLADEERPLIASVYLNRVVAEMPLQADPTVQYAAGYQESSDNWWKVPLALKDLEYDHPYNTYVIPGLPPGPIANPGLSSLQAIAQPAESDYLFFVLDCSPNSDSRHIFSRTYEEHLAYAQACHNE